MTDDLDLLHARAEGFAAGYDTGVMHGRRDERALIEQEQRSRQAGAAVRRMADIPEISPDELHRRREGRARAIKRLIAGGAA